MANPSPGKVNHDRITRFLVPPCNPRAHAFLSTIPLQSGDPEGDRRPLTRSHAGPTVRRARLRRVCGFPSRLNLRHCYSFFCGFVFLMGDWLMGDCMLDEDAVKRLRCPVTLGKLTLADDALIDRVNRLIETQGLPTRGGEPHKQRVHGGLVTEDGAHMYPIHEGIVCMLAESAIELASVPGEAAS